MENENRKSLRQTILCFMGMHSFEIENFWEDEPNRKMCKYCDFEPDSLFITIERILLFVFVMLIFSFCLIGFASTFGGFQP